MPYSRSNEESLPVRAALGSDAVTRAGCEAICPSYGHYCFGCRGLVSAPNRNSESELLQKHGLTPEEVAGRFSIYVQEGYPKREEEAK